MSDLKETLLNHPRHEHIKFYEDEHRYEYYEEGDFRKTKSAVEFDGITG